MDVMWAGKGHSSSMSTQSLAFSESALPFWEVHPGDPIPVWGHSRCVQHSSSELPGAPSGLVDVCRGGCSCAEMSLSLECL